MERSYLNKLWGLFYIFFKAGTFTFAGGLAMLPVIQRDVVEKYKFMSNEEFIEFATLSQTLPGVIALNCASFVGKKVAGTAGMLIAGFGAIISAFILMIVATILIQMVPEDGWVAGAFRGIRAASSAFVLVAAYTLGRYNLKGYFGWIVMLISFFLVLVLNISAPIVILFAGIFGFLYLRYINKKRKDVENNDSTT
ncbi:MAG: chromate transporter [Bacilli bacterium]